MTIEVKRPCVEIPHTSGSIAFNSVYAAATINYGQFCIINAEQGVGKTTFLKEFVKNLLPENGNKFFINTHERVYEYYEIMKEFPEINEARLYKGSYTPLEIIEDLKNFIVAIKKRGGNNIIYLDSLSRLINIANNHPSISGESIGKGGLRSGALRLVNEVLFDHIGQFETSSITLIATVLDNPEYSSMGLKESLESVSDSKITLKKSSSGKVMPSFAELDTYTRG